MSYGTRASILTALLTATASLLAFGCFISKETVPEESRPSSTGVGTGGVGGINTSGTTAGGGGAGECIGQVCPGSNPCEGIEAEGKCTHLNFNDGLCDKNGQCVGQRCDPLKPDDCADGAKCVDGFCCGSSCEGDCMTCGMPGKAGLCTNVLQGLIDDTCTGSGKVCGKSSCQDNLGTKSKLGEACDETKKCYYGICNRGICRLEDKEPCDSDVACVSNYCDMANNQCAPCPQVGGCAVKIGDPCSEDGECPSPAKCISEGYPCSKLCKVTLVDLTCTFDLDCITGFCKKENPRDLMGHCSTCTQGSAECPNGAECKAFNPIGYVCLLPDSKYCTNSSSCDSGNCAGFPMKCLSSPTP